MIWIVQDFMKHLFICQMTHDFKIWVIRSTEAKHNAATYESFQLWRSLTSEACTKLVRHTWVYSEHSNVIYSRSAEHLRTYRMHSKLPERIIFEHCQLCFQLAYFLFRFCFLLLVYWSLCYIFVQLNTIHFKRMLVYRCGRPTHPR